MSEYYDGTKLLSLKDINGEQPEIYLCTTNRTGGKTTYFGRLLVNRFLDKKEKFGLIYRFKYELDNVAEKFFKDIGNLFFSGHVMTEKKKGNGTFVELYLDDEPCGYAVTLNSVDQIKKYSHLFSDIKRMLFDEFQSETNHYCTDEIQKFISLHTSVARGNGEHVRYVPVYMLSNAISIINPYFVELGITSRLDDKTKFLRGNGYVLEQGYIKSASDAQKNSGFNKAFSNNLYTAYSAENVYLHDNLSFVDNIEGKNRYLCTIRYEGCDYAIKEYYDKGVIFVNDKADSTFPVKISVTTDDHNINYVMLKRNDFFLSNLRYLFEKGCFRFKDLKCKDAILHALKY